MALALLGTVGVVVAACGHKSTTVSSDGEVRDLGYALFQVDVPKHQSYVVNVDVPDSKDGETFLLLASDRPPQNVGWFDAPQRPDSCANGDLRVRAALRDECQLGGEGFLVDEQPGAPGHTFSLQHGIDDVLICDGDKDCSFFYAVVVAPQIASPRAVKVIVESGSDEGVVHDPLIRQLQ